MHVGVTRNLGSDLSDFLGGVEEERADATTKMTTTAYHVRALSFSYPQKSVMMDFAETWRTRAREARETTTTMTTVTNEKNDKEDVLDDDNEDEDEDTDDDDLDDYLRLMAESRAAVSLTSSMPSSPPLFVDNTLSGGGGSGGGGGTAMTASLTTTRDGVVISPFERKTDDDDDRRVDHRDYDSTAEYDDSMKRGDTPPLELTVKNVDAVLNEVHPYLISDGGNVSVRSVDDGEEGGAPRPRNVYLLLEGACGSCASSTVVEYEDWTIIIYT